MQALEDTSQSKNRLMKEIAECLAKIRDMARKDQYG